METQQQQATRASARVRSALVSDRDRGMALARARYPGKWSYAALGREHGISGSGARAAIRRAMRVPAIAAECEQLDRERRASIEESLAILNPVRWLVARHAEIEAQKRDIGHEEAYNRLSAAVARVTGGGRK